MRRPEPQNTSQKIDHSRPFFVKAKLHTIQGLLARGSPYNARASPVVECLGRRQVSALKFHLEATNTTRLCICHSKSDNLRTSLGEKAFADTPLALCLLCKVESTVQTPDALVVHYSGNGTFELDSGPVRQVEPFHPQSLSQDSTSQPQMSPNIWQKSGFPQKQPIPKLTFQPQNCPPSPERSPSPHHMRQASHHPCIHVRQNGKTAQANLTKPGSAQTRPLS